MAGRSPALLQTCVHELGHLFNLKHRNGLSTVPNIECPAVDRAEQDIELAWARMHRAQPPGLACYPFSETSLAALVGPSADTVLPWGLPFEDATEAGDRKREEPK